MKNFAYSTSICDLFLFIKAKNAFCFCLSFSEQLFALMIPSNEFFPLCSNCSQKSVFASAQLLQFMTPSTHSWIYFSFPLDTHLLFDSSATNSLVKLIVSVSHVWSFFSLHLKIHHFNYNSFIDWQKTFEWFGVFILFWDTVDGNQGNDLNVSMLIKIIIHLCKVNTEILHDCDISEAVERRFHGLRR